MSDSPCAATRVTDIKQLKLPTAIENRLSQLAYIDRMNWELWMESADSYKNLRESLLKRGYKNIPVYCGAMGLEKYEGKVVSAKPENTMLQRTKPF